MLLDASAQRLLLVQTSAIAENILSLPVLHCPWGFIGADHYQAADEAWSQVFNFFSFNRLFLLKIFIFKCTLGIFKLLKMLKPLCATACFHELKDIFEWSQHLFLRWLEVLKKYFQHLKDHIVEIHCSGKRVVKYSGQHFDYPVE